MPLQETSGTASYDAFGGGAAAVPNYIEDVFSTYLYTGNGSTQTITNGIDLAGKGGLVWGKNRAASWDHYLADTAQGVGKFLSSNTTSATQLDSTSLTAFNANGFSIGNAGAFINNNGVNYASWTFRKQPKFFDVVTYTGNGANRTIAHNLGSVPGCIIVKSTSAAGSWCVYHRSIPNTDYLLLNFTYAKTTDATVWNSTTATSTAFSVGTNPTVNNSGDTYVAYVFAHDAGGFGLTGTDNVISCGSYTSVSGGNFINLGYEAQFVIEKVVSSTSAWEVTDIMRGMSQTGVQVLTANTSGAEYGTTGKYPTATGYYSGGWSPGATVIYIAIRRGPMKTPTSGTSVFTPVAQTGDSNISVGFPTDFGLRYNRAGGATIAVDRLRGAVGLYTPLTDAESAASSVKFDQQNLMTYGLGAGASVATYQWRRAPGFFDEVCYTGTNSGTLTNTHNLGTTPELMIGKSRGTSTDWYVYHKDFVDSGLLDSTGAFNNSWRIGNPTATTFDVRGINNTASSLNYSTTYVAYLFASCPGVSKVGSYTGTGATQTISCGFAARFVLIKRTDSTGDWFVWDTARGMVAGTDPRLALNSTAAETNANWVYTDASGFQIVTTDATVNANGGSYIYLAIA